ncbi:intracellular coagulation inhibitor 2-like [Argiope bruennichi]|uniref:intracellular coagulation inhibitor 2-like n=1 Tax=Argiope bruennichi TaxID=94029 RepID=UPI00249479DB|nr:intracellular coagulation inhibitor 2-like [Argiope bruennichi]
MKSISGFCAFFVTCVALTSTSVISTPSTENFKKLALANNELAFNLYRKIAFESSENVLFSPFSIATIFGMLFCGARGQTAEELRQVLGYVKAGLPNNLVHETFSQYLRNVSNNEDSSNGYALKTANAAFADKRLELLMEYRRNIQALYGADVRDVDFSKEAPTIVEEINNYVRNKTNGKIDKLFDQLDPSTVLLFLNAVYFKGTWKTQFETNETREEIFYNYGLESEPRRVQFMHLSSSFPHVYYGDFQVLELPYKGENVSMLIFLPDQRVGLLTLEESLTPEKLVEVQRRLYKRNVDVLLPKFKLQFEQELSAEFQTLEAEQIFGPGADFSGMTSNSKAVVNQIVHKAVIEVNEEGSEAAAVTRIGMIVTSQLGENPQFRVDHPFLFVIVEKGSNSNMILFMGRVNDL